MEKETCIILVPSIDSYEYNVITEYFFTCRDCSWAYDHVAIEIDVEEYKEGDELLEMVLWPESQDCVSDDRALLVTGDSDGTEDYSQVYLIIKDTVRDILDEIKSNPNKIMFSEIQSEFPNDKIEEVDSVITSVFDSGYIIEKIIKINDRIFCVEYKMLGDNINLNGISELYEYKRAVKVYK